MKEQPEKRTGAQGFASWAGEFTARFSRELTQHLAQEMERMAASLMKGMPLQALLESMSPALGELVKALGASPVSDLSPEACYRVLGLSPTTSDGEVRRRYRELARRLHPDVAGPETSHLFQMVQRAYERIGRERGWKKAKGGEP